MIPKCNTSDMVSRRSKILEKLNKYKEECKK